ncbi:hypothetical protein CVT26_013525 [Gymnopilus dilepis]|uniref:Uncharacterized protein n=1 Tax=Gymnopilus dilepis TaxID=231916 RepID=A0A409Y5P6_9AGAR|nr:hypothetical protein CVT26_013525 [Gymnopilus dilepis]
MNLRPLDIRVAIPCYNYHSKPCLLHLPRGSQHPNRKPGVPVLASQGSRQNRRIFFSVALHRVRIRKELLELSTKLYHSWLGDDFFLGGGSLNRMILIPRLSETSVREAARRG